MRILQTTVSLSLILLFTTVASAKIVFSGYHEGNSHPNIYAMNDNGSNITQLTNNTLWEKKPRWSPDGKQIAFLRRINIAGSRHYNVFIMKADGTRVRQLTNFQGNVEGLAFSPDSKKLYVSIPWNKVKAMNGLYTIDIRSGDTEQITRNRMCETIGEIDLSSDGKQIVFANTDISLPGDNIWTMNADSTDARALMPPILERNIMDREMSRWSPIGEQILFIERDNKHVVEVLENGVETDYWTDAGTYRYRIHHLNDGSTQTLDIPTDWKPRSVAWMNSRSTVLFSAYTDFEPFAAENDWAQVYKYNIASGEITRLTHSDGNKANLDWVSDTYDVSPAGKQSVRWGELKKTYSD